MKQKQCKNGEVISDYLGKLKYLRLEKYKIEMLFWAK